MQVIKPNIIGLTDGAFTRASVGTFFDITGALQTAAINTPRFNYNRVTSLFEGILIEGAATNLLLNSAILSTQNVTTIAQSYTLSFYGTGSVSLSGSATGTLLGNTNIRVKNTLTFSASVGTLTLTVSGSVTLAQLESGIVSTSYITTTGATATRAADVVTGSNLIFSTATEPNAVWSSGTTYAITNKVRYLNQVWESLQNTNLNKPPDLNPTFWLNLGYDNIHAAFDTSTSTPTMGTTELTFVVEVDKINGLAFINTEASLIEISACDALTGVVFYNTTFGLTGGNVQDWYQYFFFDPLVKRTQIVIPNLNNLYTTALVTVRLKNSVGQPVKLGSFIAGATTYLGQVQTSPTVGIIDYSKKETDEFGTFNFVQRAFSKRMSVELFVDNTQLNGVQRFLTDIRATPAIWIASDDPTFEEALVVYGFYRDFTTTIPYPQVSMCDLEIEGLT